MTCPKTVSSRLFYWMALAVFLLVTVGSPALRAQSASPGAGTAKAQAKKPRPARQSGKAASVKSKPRTRGTDKAAPPASEAAQSPPESNDKATPMVRTAETVDFDTDADDGKGLEPGLDLIQAAPQRARHRSLVPASPRPEDSVVNRP